MARSNRSNTPFQVDADIVTNEVVEAFELLGNETRLAILLTLWEMKEPGKPVSELSETIASFSELRKRVGTADSGQFNYHLDKLSGTFVTQSEDGYSLSEAADQILRAVFSGTLSTGSTFEGEPIDVTCDRCDAPLVIDYEDGLLVERCTECAGFFRSADHEEGVHAQDYRPPAGLRNRSPEEFYFHSKTWSRHRFHSMLEKVCPDCSGRVSTSVYVCEDHDTSDGDVCIHCGSSVPHVAIHVCEICKFEWGCPVWASIFTDTAVKSFFYDHGLDYNAKYDRGDAKPIHDAISDLTVTGEDPFELTVTVELGGDRLTAVIDEEALVTDVTEH